MYISIKILKIATAGVLLLSMATSSAVFAADGKALFSSRGCEGCHGPAGAGSVGPRLAGQQEKYVAEQFKLIRDEKRTTGLASMMAPAVKNVSDDDIAAIASYLSGLK